MMMMIIIIIIIIPFILQILLIPMLLLLLRYYYCYCYYCYQNFLISCCSPSIYIHATTVSIICVVFVLCRLAIFGIARIVLVNAVVDCGNSQIQKYTIFIHATIFVVLYTSSVEVVLLLLLLPMSNVVVDSVVIIINIALIVIVIVIVIVIIIVIIIANTMCQLFYCNSFFINILSFQFQF